MKEAELEGFCRSWLAAWTGNEPAGLLEFYHEDAFYSDPAVRGGLRGREQMLAYFTRLLAANPSWKWEFVELMPTGLGCTLKWHATIPAGDALIEEDGVDIVEIQDGKIVRNEVFFDRVALLQGMARR